MSYKELAEKIKTTKLPSEESSSLSGKAHRYTRLPQALPQQPASKGKTARKTDVISKNWTPEVQHTAEVSSQLDSNYYYKGDLVHKRVRNLKRKNYSALIAQIKHQVESRQRSLSSKVSELQSDDRKRTAQEDQNRDELWRDMMKTQEERQYQITRITNFFT